MAWFKKKTFQDDLIKARKNLKLISNNYQGTSGYVVSAGILRTQINKIEKDILPLSRSLIAISKQTSFLLKSISTSFAKVTNDPTFNEKLKGPRLTLRQLNGYRSVLQGNREGLLSVKKKINREKTNLQGAYASLNRIEKKLLELKKKMVKARKGDYKMHKLLPETDKLLTKLSQKLYP
tara:strand:+ start:1504 stop:2040 length:537 start_codon:yes stop_codon:yes gene_type:complete